MTKRDVFYIAGAVVVALLLVFGALLIRGAQVASEQVELTREYLAIREQLQYECVLNTGRNEAECLSYAVDAWQVNEQGLRSCYRANIRLMDCVPNGEPN